MRCWLYPPVNILLATPLRSALGHGVGSGGIGGVAAELVQTGEDDVGDVSWECASMNTLARAGRSLHGAWARAKSQECGRRQRCAGKLQAHEAEVETGPIGPGVSLKRTGVRADN